MRLLCALALLCLPVRADELLLEGGGRLSCEVIEVTGDSVRVRLPHGEMRVPRSRIVRIVREKRGAYLQREARASLKGGATGSAVELYERLHAELPGDTAVARELASALLLHARGLASIHRTEAAKVALARLLALEPDHAAGRALAARIQSEERETQALLAQAHRLAGQERFDEALTLLDLWRLRRPPDDVFASRQLAQAHLALARRAALANRLRDSLVHFRAAEAYGARKECEEPLYLLRPIAVLEAIGEGDLEGGRKLLDGIATTYPDPAVPVFLRAVIHHLAGEVEPAVADYAEAARRAERSEPPGLGIPYALVRAYARALLRAAIARPPEEGSARWREIFLKPLERDRGGRHFVVYAPSASLASRIAQAADKVYEETARELLGRVPDRARAEIVVHASRQVYLTADPVPPGSPLSDISLPRLETGGVCYDTLDEMGKPLVRIEVYAGASRLFSDTLPHEVVHVVQRRGLPVFRRGKWLDEALAMLHESAQGRAERLKRFRGAGARRIPLPELLAMRSIPAGKVDLFYDESYALAAFLQRAGGAQDWRRFLAAYATGPLDRALQQVYGIDSVAILERRLLQ